MPRRPGRQPSAAAVPRVRLHLTRDHPRPAVAARLSSGEWVRLRRGACLEAADLSDDPYTMALQLSVARLDALRRQLTVRHAASHTSAAVLWGLPLLSLPDVATIVQATRPAGDRSRDVVRHHRPWRETDVVKQGCHELTTLARTTVDCLLTLPPSAALVVADGAAARGVDRQLCRELLEGARGARGVTGAREVLALADDGAESPGETLTRWVLLHAGLPVPTTQIPVETHLGTFWGDLGWPEWRLLLEYDGRAKYGAETGDALMREKRRQDAIGEAGWRVIRVTWADLRDGDAVVRRVVRAAPSGVGENMRPRRLLGQPGW